MRLVLALLLTPFLFAKAAETDPDPVCVGIVMTIAEAPSEPTLGEQARRWLSIFSLSRKRPEPVSTRGGTQQEHDAFLAAISREPEEDTPRLVYADWLDERGYSDRAEFIRIQIALDRTGIRSHWDELKTHENELLKAHPEWIPPSLTRLGITPTFRRGFVDMVPISAGHRRLLRRVAPLGESLPTATLRIHVPLLAGRERVQARWDRLRTEIGSFRHVFVETEQWASTIWDYANPFDLFSFNPSLQTAQFSRSGYGAVPSRIERLEPNGYKLRYVLGDENISRDREYSHFRMTRLDVAEFESLLGSTLRGLSAMPNLARLRLYVKPQPLWQGAGRDTDTLAALRRPDFQNVLHFEIGPPEVLSSAEFGTFRLRSPVVRSVKIRDPQQHDTKARPISRSDIRALVEHRDFSKIQALTLPASTPKDLREYAEGAAKASHPKLVISYE